MFHVAASPADNVNGQRKCLAIQRTMQTRPNRQNPLGLVSASSVELDVDPGLADRIDLLEAKTRADNMSILTLWFSAGGNPILVKLDILRRFHLTFKKATFYPEGDINYYTLRLSSEGEVEDKSDDEEWEQPERMRHFSRLQRQGQRFQKEAATE